MRGRGKKTGGGNLGKMGEPRQTVRKTEDEGWC